MIMLPEYDAVRLDDSRVKITFDPPITRAALGIPFSYIVLQQPETETLTTRFGRVTEVVCESRRWVSYLKTCGIVEDQISEFKENVGYVEPPAPELEPEPAAKEPEAKA